LFNMKLCTEAITLQSDLSTTGQSLVTPLAASSSPCLLTEPQVAACTTPDMKEVIPSLSTFACRASPSQVTWFWYKIEFRG
jgi:hypothetical protein